MIAELARGMLRRPPPTYILLLFLTAALPLCMGKLRWTIICWVCSIALLSNLILVARVVYRLPIFVTVNGTEGATVRIDAYSTTDNDSLTYNILNDSVPAEYDDYISVVGNQLVIESVPAGLLPATFFIDVCEWYRAETASYKYEPLSYLDHYLFRMPCQVLSYAPSRLI